MKRLHTLLAFILLTACADGFSDFPVTSDNQAALDVPVNIVRLDETNVRTLNRPSTDQHSDRLHGPARWTYQVGRGDILSVLVFNHPELTLPAGPDRNAADSGFRVQSDGTFFYPFVGQVQAAGLAPEEIRTNLQEGLANFIADPQLEVRVASFNSQAVNVTGAVSQPRRLPITTTPLTLIDAVNAAGGLSSDADPANASIQRNGRAYRVDLAGFLERGKADNNPLLGAGDVIFIPKRIPQEVFVLGEVDRPASIDLGGRALSLTQALSRQGGLEALRADARGVFVFRDIAGSMTVYQLSVESPAGYLLGTRFLLQEGDVIYVTRSPRQRWNDAIFGLLPTVGAVGSTSTTLNNF